MKKATWLVAMVLVPMVSMAQAARIQMPDLSGLADKAKESVDISLDGDMLKTAGSFMGGGKGEGNADVAAAIQGLQGIYIKVFTFDQPDMYSLKDIEKVVTQVQTQGWKKLLSVREKNERVEMWMRDNSADGGMLLVASEPKELVMINIVGKVDLETLSKLQGKLGVPNLPGVGGAKAPAQSAPAAQ